MDRIDLERELVTTKSEAFVLRILVTELVDALSARQAIKREDIAAALLRTEYRAVMADRIDRDESGTISGNLEEATEITREWESRFGLSPQLYTLRKAQQTWSAQGENGRSPLYPSAVIELYAEEDE